MASMTFTRVSGVLGARVDGVDLSSPLDDDEIAEIHAGLMAHQVLFFRGQHLTDDQQCAFAGRFGALSVYPIARKAGSSNPLTVIEDTADKKPSADNWHTDMTFLPAPPKLAVLSALVIPAYGGDTLWASLYAAFDALSPEMQRLCETLQVRHSPESSFWGAAEASLRPDKLAELRTELSGVTHPLVIRHPFTGRKALYISGDVFMDGIVGMHPAESRVLLGYLSSLVNDPNLAVRWQWQVGDVAMWDEYSTNHRALADHYPQHRRMRRCTVDGVALPAASVAHPQPAGRS